MRNKEIEECNENRIEEPIENEENIGEPNKQSEAEQMKIKSEISQESGINRSSKF